MIQPFDSSILESAPVEPDKTDQAAKQLEAYFLRRILAEVKIGQSGMLSGGFAGETFQKMYSDAIADAMAEAGGIGISEVIMSQLDGAATELEARPAPSRNALDVAGLVAPVDGRKTSSFGSRIHPVTGERKFHAGLDLAAAEGTAAKAAAPGVVTRAERAGGYGNLVVVKHAGGFETRYAHLSTINVAVGDRLEAGTKVGEVGQTGTATGPHLHFEVRRNGVALDPEKPLNASELITNHQLRRKNPETP